MTDKTTAETIKQAWLKEFPNGYAEIRSVLGSYMVICYLQSEWNNNIKQNDPLSYNIRVEGENAKEYKLHCLTCPPEGSNLVYESKRKRKQTIKKVNTEKLTKRFKKIKDWVKSLDLKHEVKL